MKLVVGLGNPGDAYRATRHNAGFRVVERLAERAGVGFEPRFDALYAECTIEGERVGLLMPQTWMNRSGAPVAQALAALPVEEPSRDVLVVFDEVDLAPGRLRIRGRGSDGGHRGLRDVLAQVDGDLPRLRFGVGRSAHGAGTKDHVLAPFDADEERALADAWLPRAADAVACFVGSGVAEAMNRFNADPGNTGEARDGSTNPASKRYSAARSAPMTEPMAAEPVRPHDDDESMAASNHTASRPNLANRIARPFVRFLELEVASAVLLLAMTVAALVWANSPWSESYAHFWHTSLALVLGSGWSIDLSLGHWVNDGLMTIFFFMVGMEIKREMVLGELSAPKKAMLPIMAAIGGMVIPAGVYVFFHAGGPAIRGWGVPMATDIAFAVAAMSVLGSRVPPGLRIFLLALAIVDDLGAVAVIAIFYTAEIHLDALAWAGAGLGFIVFMRWAGVRSILFYILVGIFIWYETHHSGVHATIAGVMLGVLTPTAVDHDDDDHETLVERGRHAIEHLREILGGHEGDEHHRDHGGHQRAHVLQTLSGVGRQSLSPLDFLVNLLERPVAFLIMPIFALANAGVTFEASTLNDGTAQLVAFAVALGLLVGKPVGVLLFAWVAVKMGIAQLPRGANWGMVTASGILAGIGFTVALFVTTLAFEDPVQTAGSKIGILAGSVLATILGLFVLAKSLPEAPVEPVDATH